MLELEGKIRMRIHGRITARVILPVICAIAFAGCDSFLDVNDNPNAPEDARIDIRLPGLIAGFAHSIYYGDTQLWGSEWTQQFSYNRTTRSYAEVHRYELQDTDGSTAWNYFYNGPLNEANNLIRDAADDNDVIYRGLGKFFYAWIFAHITDMWGPAPFTETFDTRIREPKYDEQKAIYDAVHRLFDEAIAEMSSPTGRRPTGNDLLFDGDMTRWVK
ncbi:MAG: SusD/RagB family nutrient-binding outer membrane lipoprotein, partial [Pseudomonas sp.]